MITDRELAALSPRPAGLPAAAERRRHLLARLQLPEKLADLDLQGGGDPFQDGMVGFSVSPSSLLTWARSIAVSAAKASCEMSLATLSRLPLVRLQ